MHRLRNLMLGAAMLVCGCGTETITGTSVLVPMPFISTILVGAVGDQMAYVETHRTELMADVTLGAGPRLRDLAELVEVRPDEYRAFALRVRAERDDLVPLLRGESTEDTQRFVERLQRVAAQVRKSPT